MGGLCVLMVAMKEEDVVSDRIAETEGKECQMCIYCCEMVIKFYSCSFYAHSKYFYAAELLKIRN